MIPLYDDNNSIDIPEPSFQLLQNWLMTTATSTSSLLPSSTFLSNAEMIRMELEIRNRDIQLEKQRLQIKEQQEQLNCLIAKRKMALTTVSPMNQFYHMPSTPVTIQRPLLSPFPQQTQLQIQQPNQERLVSLLNDNMDSSIARSYNNIRSVLHPEVSKLLQPLRSDRNQATSLSTTVTASSNNTIVPLQLPRIIALAEDSCKLNEHQYYLRQQIEAFEATEEDIETHRRGRNHPIKLKQIGIRCIHCAHRPIHERLKGSTYFPASIIGIYQAAQNMSSTHIQCGLCPDMPTSIKDHFVDLIITKKNTGAGRPYWSYAASKIGLHDTDDGGIIFRTVTTNNSHHHLEQQGKRSSVIHSDD